MNHVFHKFDTRIKTINCAHLNDGNGVKLTLMKKAAKIAKKYNASWFIYLDADEFIILNMANIIGIKHYLSHFNNIDQLFIEILFK